MTNESTRNHFLTGDFISENAVRRVFRRRRRRTAPTTTEPANGLPANPPTAGGDASRPMNGSRALRRWSVAELIVRAGAPQHTA